MSDYVVVSNTSEEIELPTNGHCCSLELQTLQRAFPGAIGLKYKNAETGRLRILFDDSVFRVKLYNTSLLQPSDGWEDKVCIVMYEQEPLSKNVQDNLTKLITDLSARIDKIEKYFEPEDPANIKRTKEQIKIDEFVESFEKLD
uniref:TDP43_N domain-containing protein n=1 Tax=Meloidogyne hapla TaxID=6305 RepID=A0A1I8C0B7_MELHA